MNLRDIAPVAIIFVVAGVALGVGAEILDDIRTDQADTGTITNESVTMSAGTGQRTGTLDTAYPIGTEPTLCANTTDSWTIPACCNNSATTLKVCNLDSLTTPINVTYDYYKEDTFWAATTNATLGIGKLAKWMPTIGLVIAAAIVIGIVVGSFAGKRRSGV